ncbi:hypothetical protein [uncultured Anaerovibrio sp.]|uniref:hypothetical protein n=1 Tax=uncultured Anaerovibrio sp. TaxID=361586 RepID=UPI00260A5C6B|nr:hypothetical protein [uncultured Anaerovibrio sp.]
MKHATKREKQYTELSRNITLGLVAGLLFVGGQYPSTALAHPDQDHTGIYSTTGDVADGSFTIDTGLAVTAESAGGASVNPNKATVSVTNNTLTVKGMLSSSGYGGYSFQEAISVVNALKNNLTLTGTIAVTADDERLYGAFGGYANASLGTIPVGSSGKLEANASNNVISGTGTESTFRFNTDFNTITIPEVDAYSAGTISPEAGLELNSALMGGYAVASATSTAGTADSRNAQSIQEAATANNNTVNFSTLNIQPVVDVKGQDGSQGQAIEYRSMVTVGGGQSLAVNTAKGSYVDHNDTNVASADGNTFTVDTLNLEETVNSVRAELEQTTTLSGGDSLAQYQSPSSIQKRKSDSKISRITESYQNTTYNITNTATANNNTETLGAIVIGGKLETSDAGVQATDIEAEGELETRAGHARAVVYLNDTNSQLNGLVNTVQSNGNTLTVNSVTQNIPPKSTQDSSGAVTQAATVTMLLHGGHARSNITQNGTDNVVWKNIKSSASTDNNTITLENISSNATESSLTGGASTSDILLMEGTGTMTADITSNTASATGNTAQMGLNTPVNMGLGCVVSGGVADVSVAGQNNFNNNAGTDNSLKLTVGDMSADASSNTIKVVGKIDSSGNNQSAATTITANGGSATAGLSFVGATTATYVSNDTASWQSGSITANDNTVDLTTSYTYTAPSSGALTKASLPAFSAIGGSASGSLGNMNVNATATVGSLNLDSTGNKITINSNIDITGSPKGQLDTSYTLTGGAASFGINNTAPVIKDAQGTALEVTPQSFNITSASPTITANNNNINVLEKISGTAKSGSSSSSSTTVDTIEGANVAFTYLDGVSAKSTVNLIPTLKATGNMATVDTTDTSNGDVASIEGSTFSGATAASTVTSGRTPAAGETEADYNKNNKSTNNIITYTPTIAVTGNTLNLVSTFDASTSTTSSGTAAGVISGGKANLDFVNYGNNATYKVSPQVDVTGNTAQVILSNAASTSTFRGLSRAYGGAAEMNVTNGSSATSSTDTSGTTTTTPASNPTGLSFTASPVLNASGNKLTVQDSVSNGASASTVTGVTGLYGGRSAISVTDLGTATKTLALSSAQLSADNNVVSTNQSAVDVYGGQAIIESNAALTALKLTMSASGNEVTIDGNCAKDVYGGSVLMSNNVTVEDTPTLSANNNTVNYNAGNILGILYGGIINSGGVTSTGTGNTLNVKGTGLTAKNIAAFNTVNFYTSAGAIKDTTLLTLNGGEQTDLSGTTINTTISEDSAFATGDVVHLLANSATIKTDATTNITNPKQGIMIEYQGAVKLSADGTSLDFTAENRSLTEQTKSLTETRAATTTLLNSGADFLASNGIDNAVNAATLESLSGIGDVNSTKGGSFVPFAALGGSNMRANSGSYVKTRGYNLNVGFARAIRNSKGTMTFGPIVEYGLGNYSSHLDDGTMGFGNTNFFGLGAFLRQNNTDGLWYEGSLRVGRMNSDYRGNLNLQAVTYDTHSTYFAAHLGIGKVNKVTPKGNVDLYSKLFYARQGSAGANLSTGEHYEFGAVNSLRWRLGGRYNYQVNKTGTMYAGLAYEYEFKGDATAAYQGMSTPSPSVKGGSGLLELGYKITPDDASPMTLDIGLNLWTGKKQGIGAVLSASWKL